MNVHIFDICYIWSHRRNNKLVKQIIKFQSKKLLFHTHQEAIKRSIDKQKNKINKHLNYTRSWERGFS